MAESKFNLREKTSAFGQYIKQNTSTDKTENWMDRITLLITAVCAGFLYAGIRVLVVVLYPAVVSYLWQYLLGPLIVSRWPTAAQADDQSRLSYLQTDMDRPVVIKWGQGSVGDISKGVRDGLLLGVFVALAPDLVAIALTLLVVVPIVRGWWRVSRAQGSACTDAAFGTLRDVLLYVAVIQAIAVAGLLPVQT